MNTPAAHAQDTTDLTVFYDGACPLCRREISIYKGINGAENIDWVNVANCNDTQIPQNVTREELLRRFHIQATDQSVKSGAEAFVEIWRHLPAFWVFAKLARIPGAMSVLEFGYTCFLKFRPTIQKLVSRITNENSRD